MFSRMARKLLATIAMRSSSIASFLLLGHALIGCDWTDPHHGPPDAGPIIDGRWLPPDGSTTPPDAVLSDGAPVTTIHITSGVAPLLVVFRDGVSAPWQSATIRTATRFEAVVQ